MKSFPKFAKKSTQTGYSLIELTIALAIVGVVIAGSVVGVQSILRSNNVNKTIAQTNTAVNKIVGKLVRDANYANANTKNLSAFGQEIWSTTEITSGGTDNVKVFHPLAGRLFVRPLGDKYDSIDENQGYIYTLTGVPVGACADLAVGVEGLAFSLWILNQAALSEGNDKLTSSATGTEVKSAKLGYNSGTATTACSGGTNPENFATITFLVPRR